MDLTYTHCPVTHPSWSNTYRCFLVWSIDRPYGAYSSILFLTFISITTAAFVWLGPGERRGNKVGLTIFGLLSLLALLTGGCGLMAVTV